MLSITGCFILHALTLLLQEQLLLLLHHRHALILLIIVILLLLISSTTALILILSDDIRLFGLRLLLILLFGLLFLELSLPGGLGLLSLPVLFLLLTLPLDILLLLLLVQLLLLVLLRLLLHASLFFLLSGHLLLHPSLLLGGSIVFLAILTADYLSHVRCRVHPRSGSPKQLLQEVVGAVGFESGDDLAGFDVDLLANHHLGQRDHLRQNLHLGILLVIGLRVHLGVGVEAVAEARGAHGRQEDVVEVAEGRLLKKLLGHLWLVKELLIHLSSRHPKVTHIVISRNI